MAHAPGSIRDGIIGYLASLDRDAGLAEISAAVGRTLGDVPASSIRSYLNLNVGGLFERTGRGRYRLGTAAPALPGTTFEPAFQVGAASLYQADCFEWLLAQAPNSIHAVVTDPPYGVVEYSSAELAKLRSGRGGIWRIPPTIAGHTRAPLPRFTTLTKADRTEIIRFFRRLGVLLARVTVPGANIMVASNPLLCHLVMAAMAEAGLEPRGYVARLTMTMRGGDRPKGAHDEYDGVSVLPRSQWEPWVILRNPLEGRAQDNLARWGTGGFRRPRKDQPFGDVIRSHPTSQNERAIAPHPSLKPQAFLRQVVRAALPLGRGIVCDPFAGSGSTLAAANAVGYASIGIERDERFVRLATRAIPLLAALPAKASDT